MEKDPWEKVIFLITASQNFYNIKVATKNNLFYVLHSFQLFGSNVTLWTGILVQMFVETQKGDDSYTRDILEIYHRASKSPCDKVMAMLLLP